jgi:integrase
MEMVCDSETLQNSVVDSTTATRESTGRKRGPVPKRRHQLGCFQIRNGMAYTLYYRDVMVDGEPRTVRARHFIGSLNNMSERAARREHARIMEQVNRVRGSVAPVFKGQTFAEAVERWREAVAPNMSPATVRPRESFLRTHIMPRFGKAALSEMGVGEIQQFATDLRRTVSARTVFQVLATIFAITRYAEKCGSKMPRVRFADLELGSTERETPVPFFTREQATDIIEAAREPFKTLFAIAWFTGLRAGEILALTVDDLNFNQKTIRVNKTSDDNTREIRQPKTRASIALLPMPTTLEAMLRDYLMQWKPNPAGILFPTKDGNRSRSRDNVVRVGLKPVLRRLGIPTEDTGLHAFRHGLATELAEQSVPLTVLQSQLRHADVKTTLKVYSHVIPQTQRDAMERVAARSIRTTVPFGTRATA